MAWLVFVPILILLIFVHELGHFVTAKWKGVQVLEFGFGYPPRLLAVKWGETEYSINLLPLGGFVRLLGEEDPTAPRSLAGRGVGTRLLILSAGSIMNILLPIVLFSASFMVPSEVEVGQVRIGEVAPQSPAEKAGICPGDIILKINGRSIRNINDASYNIQLHLGSEMTMVLQGAILQGKCLPLQLTQQGTTQRTVKVVPRWNPPQGQGPTGVMLVMANSYTTTESYPFWQAIPMGARRSLETIILAKNQVLGMIIQRAFPSVAGPVGIAQASGEVAEVGFGALLGFTALLSMNLGVLNILPIPMLDGGRIFFVLLEWVRRGKRISPEREALVHLIGFTLLIFLIVLVSYYDILRLIRGESLIR
ncbi:MAG: site-2 protease family protein [Chloroflexi bacterium]|nr:site-2 protease family protein [Chloroflexota bacterium]